MHVGGYNFFLSINTSQLWMLSIYVWLYSASNYALRKILAVLKKVIVNLVFEYGVKYVTIDVERKRVYARIQRI